MKNLAALALACATVGCVIFIGVGTTELNYVSGHPGAYGPAKVIAWAAGGGAILSVAVGMLSIAVIRRDA